MKWEFSLLAFMAAVAVASPMPQNNDGEFVNDAANDGEGGLAAAAKAEAAVLLSDNGDAGAVDEGEDFEDAVQAISDSGNQEDVETLEDAGIDVDQVLEDAQDNQDQNNNGGNNNGGNNNGGNNNGGNNNNNN